MIQSCDRFDVVLDLRCLQDPGYVGRGIGRHALALLRHAPPDFRLIGLVDESLPALLPEARAAVSALHTNAYAASRSGSPDRPPGCAVMLSPMTHDPLFLARLLTDTAILKAAVVYDFIPQRWPERYLPDPATRLGYAVALRWLARCDVFMPISRSAGADLSALLNVPDHAITVSGCPLDPLFEQIGSTTMGQRPRHLLVVGGGDPRKNPELVIRAHSQSSPLQRGAGVPLVIAGSYDATAATAFRTLAASCGGRPDLVEVPGHVSDAELIELYGRAYAIVSPSFDEGFSIPVIEGMAAGVPCIGSDIPAHNELLADPDDRFDPADHDALRPKLERTVMNAAWRTAAVARQAGVWPQFRAEAVADRFWGALRQRFTRRAPAILRGRRPRVALLSPMPPDQTGVADYSGATGVELGQLVDLHVFTETERPAPLPHVTSVRPLSALPHVHSDFDRVVSVIGNSHFHRRIFDMLRRYGGACIAHDARMLDFYYWQVGHEPARLLASKELGRTVTDADLKEWLANEAKLETLFLSEIAETAAPMIVHSRATAGLLQSRYGATATYLPFCIQRPWERADVTRTKRVAARQRLGIEANEVVIATFGLVHSTKAPEECVWALELLRGWGVQASLHFVGDLATHPQAKELQALVETLGLAENVRFVGGFVAEPTYRDYLLAADLAVQLRTYGFGSLSGALLDCIAVGLPTVTNQSLGDAADTPATYVRRIPNALSPVLLAEALADLLDTGLNTTRPEAERQAFSLERSAKNYARKLCDALDLDIATITGTAAAA